MDLLRQHLAAVLESFLHILQLVIHVVFDQKIHAHVHVGNMTFVWKVCSNDESAFSQSQSVSKKFLLAGNLKFLHWIIGVRMKSAIIKVAGFQNSVNNIIKKTNNPSQFLQYLTRVRNTNGAWKKQTSRKELEDSAKPINK